MAEKKPKSVHITNYYHKNSGGISTVYNRLLEAANRHERLVRLIVPGDRDEQEEVGEFGRIYYVKAGKSPIFDRRYRMLMPWQYMSKKARVRRILAEEMPDIIEIAEKYTLSYLAGLIKKGFVKSLNRPMLVHLSCERMDDNIKAFVSRTIPFGWFSRRVIGNYVAPMFDYHIANSDYTAQELIAGVADGRTGNHSKPFQKFCRRFFNDSAEDFQERVFINNCGVDSEFFHPHRKNAEVRRQILAEAGFPENTTILLYIGRLSPEKNIKLLPEVLRSLLDFYNFDYAKRKFRLLIAGDGPQAAWLEEKLKTAAPGKYKLLGHIGDREKLANLYANADIFIHPNSHEPFGIAPLEAMASGTPVVVPNSGGVTSYANETNAWTAEVKDKNSQVDRNTVEDYFGAVMDICNNPEIREQKIKKALATARRFSWENSTDELFRLYDELYEEFSGQRKFLLNDNGQNSSKKPEGIEAV